MRLVETALVGVLVCEPEPVSDQRGFFARLVDADVLAARGVVVDARQRSAAGNHRAGTIRGLHWQDEGAPETKLIRCTAGAVHDVVVDLRPGSPTNGAHVAVELSADNRRTLIVPPLCAHGYQTLADGTEVTYDIDGEYRPEQARGLRYDDPALGVAWPLPVTAINDRDRSWPLLDA
jgi:dTDP-4-dehydrorhamnose 3,5-epimerase